MTAGTAVATKTVAGRTSAGWTAIAATLLAATCVVACSRTPAPSAQQPVAAAAAAASPGPAPDPGTPPVEAPAEAPPAATDAPVPALEPAPGAMPGQDAADAADAPVRFLVVADRESPLSAVMGGRIARVGVKLGDTVRAGKVMVSFDCGDLEARKTAAAAEYNAAQLKYEAKVKLQGLQSASELEVQLAAADASRARSEVEVFASQLEQCRFVAPFNGRVARIYVKEGQGVSPGEHVIDIVGTGAPQARFNAPSDWIGWLAPGKRLDAVVDETGLRYPLKVARISGSVDAVSQTIAVEATFDGDTSRILPGMSGRAWRATAQP